jgi:DNA-binding transcriptional MerR regulator
MQLLTREEIWETYKISRSTLLSWEKQELFYNLIRLPSGHRRYLKSDIHQILGLKGE